MKTKTFILLLLWVSASVSPLLAQVGDEVGDEGIDPSPHIGIAERSRQTAKQAEKDGADHIITRTFSDDDDDENNNGASSAAAAPNTASLSSRSSDVPSPQDIQAAIYRKITEAINNSDKLKNRFKEIEASRERGLALSPEEQTQIEEEARALHDKWAEALLKYSNLLPKVVRKKYADEREGQRMKNSFIQLIDASNKVVEESDKLCSLLQSLDGSTHSNSSSMILPSSNSASEHEVPYGQEGELWLSADSAVFTVPETVLAEKRSDEASLKPKEFEEKRRKKEKGEAFLQQFLNGNGNDLRESRVVRNSNESSSSASSDRPLTQQSPPNVASRQRWMDYLLAALERFERQLQRGRNRNEHVDEQRENPYLFRDENGYITDASTL